MQYIGNYSLNALVNIFFTTNNGYGGVVAPSSPFLSTDILIYKDASTSQKTTTNGLIMSSPFNAVTALHLLVIDTGNNTGDTGFWQSGHDYTVVLSPAETVDNQTVVKVLGQFSIQNRSNNVNISSVNGITVNGNGSAATPWGP